MVLGREFNSQVCLETRWLKLTTWWQKRTKIIKIAKRGKSHQKKNIFKKGHLNILDISRLSFRLTQSYYLTILSIAQPRYLLWVNFLKVVGAESKRYLCRKICKSSIKMLMIQQLPYTTCRHYGAMSVIRNILLRYPFHLLALNPIAETNNSILHETISPHFFVVKLVSILPTFLEQLLRWYYCP